MFYNKNSLWFYFWEFWHYIKVSFYWNIMAIAAHVITQQIPWPIIYQITVLVWWHSYIIKASHYWPFVWWIHLIGGFTTQRASNEGMKFMYFPHHVRSYLFSPKRQWSPPHGVQLNTYHSMEKLWCIEPYTTTLCLVLLMGHERETCEYKTWASKRK